MTSIATIQKTLRDWAAKNADIVKQVNLILGFGYDNSQLKELRHPTRDELDEVSKDVPVADRASVEPPCATQFEGPGARRLHGRNAEPAGRRHPAQGRAATSPMACSRKPPSISGVPKLLGNVGPRA